MAVPVQTSGDQQGAFKIIATDDDCGKRLDFFVADAVENGQRTRIVDLVRQQAIVVNDRVRKPSYRLKPGDVVAGCIPPPEPICFEPEQIPLDILYDDRDLVVINKQAGLVVHPAPGHWTGTLVNGLLYHYPDIEPGEDEIRPGIVHRLDRDTSGVMVIAKNRDALYKLSAMFRDRRIVKHYVALVHGVVQADAGVIDLPIGRHRVDRKKMSTDSPRGRRAETHYTVEKRYGLATRLLCDIKTGRTHQIRVHCQSIKHPIVGDAVYDLFRPRKKPGGLSPIERILHGAGRQMLHAYHLEFVHPATLAPMYFTAPLPSDMLNIIDHLEQAD